MLINLQLEHRVLFQLFLNFVSPVAEEITQVGDHVKRLTSQLINGISRVLQKLLKYFNGTIISTSFVLPAAGAFPVIFNLYLNDSDDLDHLRGIDINFPMFLHNYHYIQLSYT